MILCWVIYQKPKAALYLDANLALKGGFRLTRVPATEPFGEPIRVRAYDRKSDAIHTT
jgi:hypothetical protein